MTVSYIYSTEMIIVFDDKFELRELPTDCLTIEDAVEHAKSIMLEYDYDVATICDSNTGEILAEIEND